MRKENFIDKWLTPLEFCDIPTIVMAGSVVGYLIVGLFFATLGGLCDAPEGQIWTWKSIIGGLACIGIATVIAGITALYWWKVPRKRGTVFPKLTGFGLLLALMSMFSSVMVSIELTGWITYGR